MKKRNMTIKALCLGFSLMVSASTVHADSYMQKVEKGILHTTQLIGAGFMVAMGHNAWQEFRRTRQPKEVLGMVVALSGAYTLAREGIKGFQELLRKPTLIKRACRRVRSAAERIEASCC